MSLHVSQHISHGSLDLEVDLQLPASGITALFGPSGSGKTSLLRAIAGLDMHAGGVVNINGRSWQDKQQFVPVHKRNIAYVFQEHNLFDHLNVLGNLQYAAERTNAPAARLEKAIALTGITHLLQQKPASLSGGERQKTAIARAVLMQPDLMLMDEPFAGIDQDFTSSFLPQLRMLLIESGFPVLYVSHSPAEIAQLADHMVMITPGKSLSQGPLNELLTSPGNGLATRADAESVIEAVVEGFDEEYGLLHLAFSGGTMVVSGNALPAGQQIRIRIMALDVSLTLEAQSSTSILNIFPVSIIDLMPCSSSQFSVLLALGSDRLLARVTKKSVNTLNLQAGMNVFAQIKSVAVLN